MSGKQWNCQDSASQANDTMRHMGRSSLRGFPRWRRRHFARATAVLLEEPTTGREPTRP